MYMFVYLTCWCILPHMFTLHNIGSNKNNCKFSSSFCNIFKLRVGIRTAISFINVHILLLNLTTKILSNNIGTNVNLNTKYVCKIICLQSYIIR